MWVLCSRMSQSILAGLICSAVFLPSEIGGAPALGYYSPSYDSAINPNYEQLAGLLKQYVHFLSVQPTKHISGQMSLRSPRSELIGEMANSQRLHQLQEIDRMYGAKSRPRFGKRNWMTQDDGQNFGYYESPNNANVPSAESDQNRR